VVARYLERHATTLVRGKRVVDLSAGCGLPGELVHTVTALKAVHDWETSAWARMPAVPIHIWSSLTHLVTHPSHLISTAGIVASHLGASEVVATDLDSNLPLLQRNLKANGMRR
jgi:predicted nicotinamide N-methyase